MNKIIFCLILLLLSFPSFGEFSYLGRSPEALLMGDAFTAIADDENTVFYNPAAMARHKGVSIYTINPTVSTPKMIDINFSLSNFGVNFDNKLANFPSTPEGMVDKLLGYPLYLQMGMNPTIKFQGFSFMLFANYKNSMILENAIRPILDMNYNYDRGFITSYAFTVGGPSMEGAGIKHSFGASIKSVNREGIDNSFGVFSPKLIEILSSANLSPTALKNLLGYSKGSGWGFDLGYELNSYNGPTRIGFGVGLTDIGGTSFKKEEGVNDVPVQDMAMNIGAAWEQKYSFFKYALAADFSNAIDTNSSFGTKLKLGGRFEMPFMKFFLGWNGGYTSYGMSFDILAFNFKIGFYGVEQSHRFRVRESERMVLSLNLLPVKLDF